MKRVTTLKEDANGKRVRLAIDAAFFLLLVFNVGVSWQQIQSQDKRIIALETSNNLTLMALQRLASVEAKVDMLLDHRDYRK